MAADKLRDVDLRPRGVRRKILFVRVSEEEDAAITGAAAAVGLTVVDFIREATRDKILSLAAISPKRKTKK